MHGDPAVDAARSAPFAACCERVAAAHGQSAWEGCSCTMHSDEGGYGCSFYGSQLASMVRDSIYVAQLRAFLRYHRPSELLLFDASDVNADLIGVVRELAVFAGRGTLTPARWRTLLAADISDDEHANVHEYPSMLNQTHEMLQAFYAPYNRDLFELIGRELSW
jgi:hypothetical protein